jgi:Right handed beta helix region
MPTAGVHVRHGGAALIAVLLLPATFAGGAPQAEGAEASPESPALSKRSVIPRRVAKGCHRLASPRGSDGWRGSRRRPYRSVKRLVDSLRRGQTGCLAAGTYRHSGMAKLTRPRTTLRSVRGARATVDGAVWITEEATGARVSRLRLTASDPEFDIPLKVQADRARVSLNRISGKSRSTICMLVGSVRTTRGVVIARNRIRACGRSGEYDHLIYLSHTRGTIVRGNVLYSNPGGWAVHMYPDADGTLVERNLIHDNVGGVVFAGDGTGLKSDGNVVRNNAITGSGPRWNIESSWSGGPSGTGNRAYRNCLHTLGPGGPAGIGDRDGFTADHNYVLAGLPYVSVRLGDFRFMRRSRCNSLVGRVVGVSRRRR